MQAVDFSRVRVLDLSQNFSVNSPPFAFYEGPTIKWVKKLAFEGVNAQLISSTNHIATHLDSPLHFHDPGPDVADIPAGPDPGGGGQDRDAPRRKLPLAASIQGLSQAALPQGRLPRGERRRRD